MSSVQDILQRTHNILDVEVLLGAVLQGSRAYLRAHTEQVLTPFQDEQIQQYLKRYQQGEPVAYIVGMQEFWSLPLKVNQHVLIPRPETEGIVESVLQHYQDQKKLHVLDVGTGSGAIALALAHEKPHWHIEGIDQSVEAIALAKENAERLGLNDVQFYVSDWFSAVSSSYDMIVSNPPYIAEDDPHLKALRFEPHAALVSGHDGLQALTHLIAHAKHYLKPEGLLVVEHGYDQATAVRELFFKKNYQDIKTLLDLQQHPRVTYGYRRG